MAQWEQYRGNVDALLAKTGLDYRWFDGSELMQGRMSKRLADWAAANPNDPLAKQIQSNPNKFAQGLQVAISGLKSGGQAAGDVTAFLSGAYDATQAAEPQADPRQSQFRQWISQFANEMSKQVGPGDPMFDSLSRMGAARASQGVGASGIRVGRGGLGDLAIQQGAMNAVQPYLMQRQEMAKQAMGMLDSSDRGWEGLSQGAHQLDLRRTEMENAIAQQQYGQEADAAGGFGATIGGLAGGALGLGLTAVNPALAKSIPGLVTGGASLGASFGQGGVRRPSYRQPAAYKFGGGF